MGVYVKRMKMPKTCHNCEEFTSHWFDNRGNTTGLLCKPLNC